MQVLDYRRVSDFFDAFSNPTRIEILAGLLKGRKCVSDIRELLDVNQPNVSQHLSLLRSSGIVDWRQEGKRRCYFLKDPRLIRDIFEVLKRNRLL